MKRVSGKDWNMGESFAVYIICGSMRAAEADSDTDCALAAVQSGQLMTTISSSRHVRPTPRRSLYWCAHRSMRQGGGGTCECPRVGVFSIFRRGG